LSLFRCVRCLYPNTKPDIWFDENGLCSACIAFDARNKIAWKDKELEFLEIVRRNPGKSHDVIVACSGGKDSTWQIVKCLELGLRPLAVTATTDSLSELGRRNLDNISNLCDHVEVTVHKPTRRKIAKFALEEVGDISWCEHHLIWSVPAREAVNRGIPIVLYGEAPQNEYGAGPKGSERVTELTREWTHEFGGLLGLRLSDLSEILDIEPRHLDLYRQPESGFKALFMGAFFEWDGYRNYEIAKAHGFTPYYAGVEGSGYSYENLDNLQTGLHDYLRYLKFGYTRADDIASSHIRRGRLDRAPAVQRVLRHHNMPRTYLGVDWADILAEIGVTLDQFDRICERFTNREVVDWASRPESYQCSCSTTTAASRADNSTKTVASAA
jgi:N-acetyl sugar amidotransferase